MGGGQNIHFNLAISSGQIDRSVVIHNITMQPLDRNGKIFHSSINWARRFVRKSCRENMVLGRADPDRRSAPEKSMGVSRTTVATGRSRRLVNEGYIRRPTGERYLRESPRPWSTKGHSKSLSIDMFGCERAPPKIVQSAGDESQN